MISFFFFFYSFTQKCLFISTRSVSLHMTKGEPLEIQLLSVIFPASHRKLEPGKNLNAIKHIL